MVPLSVFMYYWQYINQNNHINRMGKAFTSHNSLLNCVHWVQHTFKRLCLQSYQVGVSGVGEPEGTVSTGSLAHLEQPSTGSLAHLEQPSTG